MIKVMSIFGTRPEAIKMAPIVKELEKYPGKIKSIICVSAQHRHMLDQVLNLFKIKPNYDLNIMTEGQTLFDVSKRVLHGLESILEREQPDIILVQGDTTTVFVSAVSAFYHKISVGHVEAGLRTNNKYSPYPEEMNRRVTSVLTDLHFAPTKTARDNLLRENFPKKSIFVTGNTVIDALFMTVKGKYEFKESLLNQLDYKNKKIILITAHRRENFGKPFENICWAFRDIVKNNPDVELVYPVHPNPNVLKPVNKILIEQDRIHLIKPIDYDPFVQLMNKAYLILTDSGGIQEEAPSLGKPVLVLRKETERPEAVKAGTVRIVGTDRKKIVKETEKLLYNKKEYIRMSKAHNPYGDGKAAKRIVKIIISKVKHNNR